MTISSDKGDINIIARKIPGVINMPLQIRRGLEAERSTLTSLNGLVVGELLYTTDSQKIYIGTGAVGQHQGVAITGYTNEDAQDAVGPLLQGGTHVGISFVYDDITPSINATVNLSNYQGIIKADSFNGSFVADNSTVLIDGTEGSFNLDGTVKGNVVPNTDSAYDLGSSSYKFKDLYLSGSSIHLGNALLTSSGSAINLPAGSTINGEPLNSPLTLTQLSANIIADDSTVMVNTTTKVITAGGGFVGDINGDVVGNVTGNLNGNVTGDVTGDINGVVTGTAGSSIRGTVQGNVIAESGHILIDATTKVFTGTFETVNTTISSNSITCSTILNLGTSSALLDLDLNLDNNLQIRHIINPLTGKYITVNQSRGTLASPAAAQAGDELGGILFKAYTNASTSAVAGIIGFTVDPTAIISGGDFIKTLAVISASTDTDNDIANAFVLDSAGVVTSNAFVASKYNQLAVYADDAARSTAIPTPAAGMMVFMTSGTSPAVTNKAVVYDGSAWVALH